MTSFLQYCATCEKQILVPSSTVLYCSESCRKRDHANGYASNYTSNPSPPLTPYYPSDGESSTPAPSIIPPNRPSTFSTHHSPTTPTTSAAADSLRRFQASTSTLPSKPITPHARNPSLPNLSSLRITPRSTTSSAAAAIPSSSPLDSPSFAASSSYYGPTTTTTTRPLAPRTASSYYYSSSTPKSIDLVTPHALAMTPSTQSAAVPQSSSYYSSYAYGPNMARSARAAAGGGGGMKSLPASYVEERSGFAGSSSVRRRG